MILLGTLLSQGALAQPRTLSDDDVIRGGVHQTYSAPAAVVVGMLERRLCTPGCAVVDQIDDDKGHYMQCAEAKAKPLLARLAWFLPDSFLPSVEAARPWAIVKERPGSTTYVTIGAALFRDDKLLQSARDHFFQPRLWAQGVWAALGPPAVPPARNRNQ